MRTVASASEGVANDRLRHLSGRKGGLLLGCPLVLCLGLGDILNLFLYRREQGEQRKVRLRRV